MTYNVFSGTLDPAQSINQLFSAFGHYWLSTLLVSNKKCIHPVKTYFIFPKDFLWVPALS